VVAACRSQPCVIVPAARFQRKTSLDAVECAWIF
jgi:hypothetical protein